MYKKLKVHLIKSDNKNKMQLFGNQIRTDQFKADNLAYWMNIYLTNADETIKVGDWYLSKHNIEGKVLSDKMILNKADLNFICNHYVENSTIWQKVIASTDSSLLLPQIPKDWIKYFITQYNNNVLIGGVHVEYEYTLGNEEDENQNLIPVLELKLSKNNTISIKLMQTVWNRKEITNLLIRLHNDCSDEMSREIFDINKWIFKYI